MTTLEKDTASLEEQHSRKFPIVHTHNGIVYERYKVTRENMWNLRNRALPFEKELGYNSFRTHDEVRHNIQPDRRVEVVFGRTIGYHPKDVAIVTEEVREFEGLRVLVIGIRVNLPRFRGKGLQTHLTQDSIIRHQPDAATGKTRKWQIPRIYEKTGLIKKFHPIDEDITSQIVNRWLTVLNPGEREDLDLTTGVYSGFPEANPKDFLPTRNNANAVRIYERMIEIGADPGRGIGFRYWAEIDKKALEAASATYNPTEESAHFRSLRMLRLFNRRTVPAVFGLQRFFL